MKYVYIIQSIAFPEKRYVGRTKDFERRLEEHNAGRSKHTSKFYPWKAKVLIRFEDDSLADAFEQYLKSPSGRGFTKKHLW